MNHFIPRLLAVTITATLTAPAQAELALDVIGDHEIALEGLIQADGNWFHNDVADLNGSSGNNGNDSEFELRRAEVVLKGKSTKFDWVVSYDAKADKYLDVNLRWKMGTSYLMAGQFKQVNSVEELSSTKNNDFISKAMTTNTFAVSRRVGMAFGDDRKNWGYSVNAFGRELTRNLGQGQGYGARFYYAPIANDDQFLHLGLSAVDYDTADDTQRWRSRPGADLATARLVDTGNLLDADRNRVLGLEAIWARGPFKVQGEYMRAETSRNSNAVAGDYAADGWYLSGVWNLTGETWGYKKGVPSTSLPDNPAAGMWQLALRYDDLNLDDGAVRGGDEQNITLGVNYYLRSNFKVSANYVAVRSSRFNATAGTNVDDDPSIFETRLQFYW